MTLACNNYIIIYPVQNVGFVLRRDYTHIHSCSLSPEQLFDSVGTSENYLNEHYWNTLFIYQWSTSLLEWDKIIILDIAKQYV